MRESKGSRILYTRLSCIDLPTEGTNVQSVLVLNTQGEVVNI